jgi:histidine triad (HIT) family protein
MHTEPATAGHALVIPRRHAKDLYSIDAEVLAHTVRAAQRAAVMMRDRLGAEGVNLINACRPAAWQTVFHFHMHVVPRYRGDGVRLPWTPARGDLAAIAASAEALRR